MNIYFKKIFVSWLTIALVNHGLCKTIHIKKKKWMGKTLKKKTIKKMFFCLKKVIFIYNPVFNTFYNY